MPRESRFRRSAIHSPARRRLFSDEINHIELTQRLQSELDEEVNVQSRRWGFNFQAGIPLNCSSNDNATAAASSSSSTTTTTSATETFIYESLNANEVPLVYRSHTIIRKEIPAVGVVEIKHYPSGRGPIQTPTKPLESPQKPTENARKRHLPTPSTTPMKLRKRASPHKTPVNPGPKHNNEHSPNLVAANASKQRPRRNLTEKFKDTTATTTASAVPHSTSSSEE